MSNLETTLEKLIIISGPTAAAKSRLACAIAPQFSSSLLSIDSVQVYKDLDIGSAKIKNLPNALSQELIDLNEPNEQCNVADYIAAAKKSIANVLAKSETPVLVGGSNLYITCLLHGLAAMPQANKDLRLQFKLLSTQELYSKLETLDSSSAQRLHANDRTRIERALETFLIKGVSAKEVQAGHAYNSLEYLALILVVIWPRQVLYERINQRTEQMLSSGWIAESEGLFQRYGECCALKSLGYAQIVDYLQGKLSRTQLNEKISQATRNYAKRQLTFWRNEPSKRGWQIYPTQSESERVHKSSSDQVKEFYSYEFTLSELQMRIKSRLSQEFKQTEVWYINGAKLLTGL